MTISTEKLVTAKPGNPDRKIPLPEENQIPRALSGLRVWKNWKRNEEGRKIPARRDGRNANSYPQGAYDFAAAVRAAEQNPELGVAIIITRTGGFCGVDVDFKHYRGTMARMGGHILPVAVAVLAEKALWAGGYAEMSPSGRGIHILLPGTYHGEHAKKGHFTGAYCAELGLDADDTRETVGIEVDFYTGGYRENGERKGGRFFTFTGEILHSMATGFTLAPNAEADALIKRCAEEFAGSGGKGVIAIGDQHAVYGGGANYVPAAAVQGLPGVAEQRLGRELLRNIPLARLWDGDLAALHDIPTAAARGDFSHSAGRFQVLLACARAAQGDASKIAELFARSQMASEKAFSRRGDRRLIEIEAERAAAAYHASNARRAEQGTRTGAVHWTQKHELALMQILGTQAKGGPKKVDAVRALAADLLGLIQKGQYHAADGGIELHTGGLSAISERIGGATTSLADRLQWLAGVGVLAAFRRDSEGRPVVVMAASGDDCALLKQECLPAERAIIPGRPAPKKSRKPRAEKVEQAKVAREPLLKRIVGANQWAMWMLHRGASSVEEIAAGTGISVRTAKKQVKALQGLGMVSDTLHPLCTPDEFEVARLTEQLARTQKTRERRAEARAAYRAFKASRAASTREAAMEAAEKAALDAEIDWRYANAAD